MTDKEIIEMAEQAGLWQDLYIYGDLRKHLEAFAKLVAAKEREECAEICDEIYTHAVEDWEGANFCGDAIRARGQA